MTKKKTTKKAVKQEFVIVRCRNAGVHAGYMVARRGCEVDLRDSRRIWYWKGAASLSELAVYGAKDKDACRFGVKLSNLTVLDACEIIACQPDGQKMIEEQPEWRA